MISNMELHNSEAGEVVWDVLESHSYVIYKMKPGYSEIHERILVDHREHIIARPKEK